MRPTYQSADSLVKEIVLKTRPEFHSCLISVLVLLFVPFAVSAQTSPKDSQGFPILGFSPANAAAERNLEAIFEALPSPEKAREWHRLFTAAPHPAASEQNNKLAEFLARLMTARLAARQRLENPASFACGPRLNL